MNIDLFFSSKNFPGLISNEGFGYAPSGIIFDVRLSTLTLEFAPRDKEFAEPFEMNVAVSDDFAPMLVETEMILLGVMDKQELSKAWILPMGILEDDGDFAYAIDTIRMNPARDGLREMVFFLKDAEKGQPVHREHIAQGGSIKPVTEKQDLKEIALTKTAERGLKQEARNAPTSPANRVAPPVPQPKK
ncbi:MAG: hypothetical protein CL565_05815 [Alphaproteobacteria bacterium]|nr:hypothetical protein [Alphaproteobacteria bacterium]|tara:strand:+ start:821 stop:1387 length:567 start_codon:yes stop_codon:yes gene_type:complete